MNTMMRFLLAAGLILGSITSAVAQKIDLKDIDIRFEPLSFIFGETYSGSYSNIGIGYPVLNRDDLKVKVGAEVNFWNSLRRNNDMYFNGNRTKGKSLDTPLNYDFVGGVFGQVFLPLKPDSKNSPHVTALFLKYGIGMGQMSGQSDDSNKFSEKVDQGVAVMGFGLGLQFLISGKVLLYPELSYKTNIIWGNSAETVGLIPRNDNNELVKGFVSFNIGISIPLGSLFSSSSSSGSRPSDSYTLSIKTHAPSSTSVTLKDGKRDVVQDRRGNSEMTVDGDKVLTVEVENRSMTDGQSVQKAGPAVVIVDLTFYDGDKSAIKKIKDAVTKIVDENDDATVIITNGVDKGFGVKSGTAGVNRTDSAMNKIMEWPSRIPQLFAAMDFAHKTYATQIESQLAIKNAKLYIITSKRAISEGLLSDNGKVDFVQRFKRWGFTRIPLSIVHIITPGEYIKDLDVSSLVQFGITVEGKSFEN